jgi:plasmid stabilization system protein ParE
MKITKRQLRRIIKEERKKILAERHPDVQEGIWRSVHQSVWEMLEADFANDDYTESLQDPTVAESVADALESIAKEIRDDAAGRNPGGSIG